MSSLFTLGEVEVLTGHLEELESTVSKRIKPEGNEIVRTVQESNLISFMIRLGKAVEMLKNDRTGRVNILLPGDAIPAIVNIDPQSLNDDDPASALVNFTNLEMMLNEVDSALAKLTLISHYKRGMFYNMIQSNKELKKAFMDKNGVSEKTIQRHLRFKTLIDRYPG